MRLKPDRRDGPWHRAILHGQRLWSRWRLPHLPPCDGGMDAVELKITPAGGLDVENGGFETLWTTPRALDEERSVFSLGRANSERAAVDRLCWDRLLDVRIGADRIECRVRQGADRHEVEARLLGPATAYWLERLGHHALHASALAVDGRAVVVAGASGAGKSTCAAASWAAGAQILADDLRGISAQCGETPSVSPDPAWIRLEPEIARRFGLHFPRRARRRRGKVRVHLEDCRAGALPVAALVLLGPRDDVAEGTPSEGLKRLGPGDAFARLQAASYVGPDVAQRAGFVSSRFQALTHLLADVPVYELTLPEGVGKMERAVAQTLAGLLQDGPQGIDRGETQAVLRAI